MAERQWTLQIFSDDPDELRQYTVSRKLVRFTVAGALILLSVLTSLAAGFFVKEAHRLRAERLDKENELLASEVETIRGRLAILERSLNELSEMDEHYRLLAGLEPIDEDVRQAGIGGPGTATLAASELYQLDPEQGEKTFSAAYDLNAMIRRARLLVSSWSEATDSLANAHDRLESHPSILPAPGGYVSSGFSLSRWHPILNRPRPHEGIDVAAPKGSPILAAAKGVVTYAGWRGDFGKMVEIDHGHGYVTRYAHASRVLVRRGQVVERGDKIAEVGETGLAVGPHLHYEVLQHGRPINPKDFIFEKIVD